MRAMTEPKRKPLLPLLSSVVAEHVREFRKQAIEEFGEGLEQLREDLGAHQFDERLREFANEARAQFKEGVEQFRDELEAELKEIQARKADEGAARGARDDAAQPTSSPDATSDATAEASGGEHPSDEAGEPEPDEQETKPMPRVRVVDPPENKTD
jgi:hypothetical protein